MNTSQVSSILKKIKQPNTKLGDLRSLAKDIKKDHELAILLWQDGGFLPRQLALLIMDPKQLDLKAIEGLAQDMQTHPANEQTQLIDWLMANQLTKNKTTKALIQTWKEHASPLLRRTFWYYQGRLRWMGQEPPADSEALLCAIEKNIEKEAPTVQWAMNFTAGWMGIHQPELRERCIALGEKTGLFKDEKVSKNCTPNYLPQFISIMVEKLGK